MSSTSSLPTARRHFQILNATVLNNRWIPEAKRTRLNPKQSLFLAYEGPECLYGGAAGGGKSIALLMAALQYVDYPGYHALLLRRTFQQLSKPEALMDVAKEWLYGTGAAWNQQDHRWTFPSGATLTFGHMENETNKYDYQSAAYSFVGFDELTQFTEAMYTYLFSRLRRKAGGTIPTRMRCACNPGGVGHAWVKRRFIPDEFMRAPPEEQFSQVWSAEPGRLFIPARLEDNPALDIADYEGRLAELDPVEREQLRRGDWKAHAGGRFQPDWWQWYDDLNDVVSLGETEWAIPKMEIPKFVIIDPAASKKKTSKYTAIGVFGDLGHDRLLVLEMVRRRLAVHEIVPAVDEVCRRHRPVDWVGYEADGFQKGLADDSRDEERFPNIPAVVALSHENKGKLARAQTAIILAHERRIWLPRGARWTDDFVAECGMFTGDDKQDTYTDQVDVLAYAAREKKHFSGGELPTPPAGRRPGPFS